MSKAPAVRPKELARVARKLGFDFDRQKGGHSERSGLAVSISTASRDTHKPLKRLNSAGSCSNTGLKATVLIREPKI